MRMQMQDVVPLEPSDGIKLSTHIFLLLCVGVCVGFGFWAWFGKLDIVSVATGEAKPASQVKEVQHLEGGIVAAILVREGATVNPDSRLLSWKRHKVVPI